MDKSKIVIVIPLYKETPDAYEIASYNRCLEVLGSYNISVFCSHELNLANYNINNPSVSVERFDGKYFRNVKAYNALMLSREFYDRYDKYTYMLMYHLDAWVFTDALDKWCSQGYDYVGAPWTDFSTGKMRFTGVGNGGFCLRNINKCLTIFDRIAYYKSNPPAANRLLSSIQNAYNRNVVSNMITMNFADMNIWNMIPNEDGLWSYGSPYILPGFVIPRGDEAMRFSMETCAPELYKLNNNRLPFGCHAWAQRTQDFWKDHINALHTPVNSTKESHEK